jgi:lipopolysaccharide/colanic/teichoic acid biosynthesis glycosyltransferase
MVTEQNESPTVTREQTRKKRKAARKNELQAKKEQKLEKKIQKFRKRLVPIWLRLIIIAIFSVAALFAGLMIGYGIIGEGEPMDALDMSTWQHVIDIVLKEK